MVAWFASDCLVCHRALPWAQRSGVCLSCWAGLSTLDDRHCCRLCAQPVDRPRLPDEPHSDNRHQDAERPICTSCRRARSRLSEVRALHEYDRIAQAILLRGKLGADRTVLEILGRELADATRCWGIGRHCDVVVPVPSHPWLRIRRGFVPAADLARPVSLAWALPLQASGLRKTLASPLAAKRQSGLDRRSTDPDSFRCRQSFAGARVLLVDDIMTTGTTLTLCAEALTQAGAKSVRAAVWARSL